MSQPPCGAGSVLLTICKLLLLNGPMLEDLFQAIIVAQQHVQWA